MTAPEVPREDLAQALLARAESGAPVLLAGPPGSGKTTLLRALAERLERRGFVVVRLDLMGAASSPGRFVVAALDALPAGAFGRHLSRATEIRRLAGGGRAREAAAVEALLSLWASLDDADGRPVALLLDEATEIRSLAYFSGLRQIDRAFGAAVARRRRGTVLATSFPTLAGRLWDFDAIAARPLGADDLAPVLAASRLREDPAALARASFGWPRYVAVLLDGLLRGRDLPSAWAEEMAPGGRLELACRHTYETLLLRSRGYGMSKAVLATVAEYEGENLTALVARLGRTPGAVRDYLQWLVGVDALRMVRKRYVYVDGLVRQWVRLHGRGAAPGAAALRSAAREAVEAGTGVAAAAAAPPALTPEAPQPVPPRPRRDTLMEID